MMKFIKWMLYTGLVFPILFNVLDVYYKINYGIVKVYYLINITNIIFSISNVIFIFLSIYMFKESKKNIYIFILFFNFFFLLMRNWYRFY
jgi:hypothetical protein